MRIVTTYGTTPSGAGKVTAKGNGKQQTTRWDQSKSTDWNHGEAAGNLLVSGKFDGFLISLTDAQMDAATHDSNDSGTVHTFEV